MAKPKHEPELEPLDPYLTVKQAAARLGLPAATVYDLVGARKLPHYRFGTGRGTIRLRASDLDAYAASCRVEEEEPADRRPPRYVRSRSSPTWEEIRRRALRLPAG